MHCTQTSRSCTCTLVFCSDKLFWVCTARKSHTVVRIVYPRLLQRQTFLSTHCTQKSRSCTFTFVFCSDKLSWVSTAHKSHAVSTPPSSHCSSIIKSSNLIMIHKQQHCFLSISHGFLVSLFGPREDVKNLKSRVNSNIDKDGLSEPFFSFFFKVATTSTWRSGIKIKISTLSLLLLLLAPNLKMILGQLGAKIEQNTSHFCTDLIA